MKRTSILTAALVTAAGTIAVPQAGAAPVVRQATGADPAAIQAAVDQFRADLGGGTTAGANGSFGGVRREINWDGTPDAFSSGGGLLPGGFFNANSPRGAAFSTPGIGFLVSADDDNPADAGLRFSDVRASYATAFGTFSPQRLFTSVGSTIADTRFFLPGTDTEATTSGFGVVFTDVDTATGARLQLFDNDGTELANVAAPATPGDASMSFVGISFDAGERVARARTTSGAAPIQAEGNQDDLTQGGPADLVVMDDFLYGEPVALGADQGKPRITLRGVKRKMTRRALLKGIKARITTDEPATLDVSLRATGRADLARAAANVVLVERRRGFGTGPRTVNVKPRRSALGDATRFRTRLRIVAVDRAGNRRVTERTVRITG